MVQLWCNLLFVKRVGWRTSVFYAASFFASCRFLADFVNDAMLLR